MEKSKVAVDESTNGNYRNEVPSDLESLPPAYIKPTTPNLKIARILSLTLIAVTVLVGVMVVTGIYVHHANKCQCDKDLAEENQFRPAMAARIDRMDRMQAEASETGNSNQKKLPMPLKLELDATLGALMKSPKNKKAKVDCVVETKKASQVISEEPKTLQTPFGNFSTDPKLVHLTGEKMVFSCFSAVEQSKKSSRSKKPKGLLPRPRRSTKETCACNCDC